MLLKRWCETTVVNSHLLPTSLQDKPCETTWECISLWLGDVKFADRVRRSRTIRLKRIDSDLGRMGLAGPPHPPKGITGSPTIPTSQTMRSKSISTCTGTVSSGTPNQRAARRPLTITKPQHKLDLDLFFCSDFLHQATYTWIMIINLPYHYWLRSSRWWNLLHGSRCGDKMMRRWY